MPSKKFSAQRARGYFAQPERLLIPAPRSCYQKHHCSTNLIFKHAIMQQKLLVTISSRKNISSVFFFFGLNLLNFPQGGILSGARDGDGRTYRLSCFSDLQKLFCLLVGHVRSPHRSNQSPRV